MIALSKDILKFTFESEVGSEIVNYTLYVNGEVMAKTDIEKDYAYDVIQVLLKNGYKQGE